MLHCTDSEAAGFLGVSLRMFRSMIKHDVVAKRAWEEGHAEGKVSIRRKQFRLADSSAPMAIFLGKQYLNQSDVIVTEHSGRDGGPIQTQEYDASQLSYDEAKQLRDLLRKSAPSRPDEDDKTSR